MLVVGERHEPGRGRDRLEHAIGKEVDQRDEEVARAHRRVADLDLQQSRGRVEGGEFGEAIGLGAALACQRLAPSRGNARGARSRAARRPAPG